MADLTRKITIYDVAKRANVTIATVSRVINGKDNVSAPTKEIVMQAIEDLNYYPSPIASGLSKRKSQEIGVLVPFFFGEFFLKLLDGIAKELHDFDLILYDATTPEQKKKLIAKVVGENKLDGLVVVSLPVRTDEEINLRKARFPIALIDTMHPSYSSVCFDNTYGAYKAVEYLTGLGHKRIAIISGAIEDPFHFTVASERLKGYKMGLSMANIPINDKYIQINDWSRIGANLITKKLMGMKEPPTAIFCVSDLQAVGALETAREMGFRVPEDLSILGYDNMDFSDYIGLSTMSQPLSIASQLGIELLKAEIDSGINKKEKIILQPALIERATVAPVASL
ncbi:MAG: hypothetical protein A2014_03190 [Spirochaetes bacterium GWF1_49_6]|nr:MAG: hypothetical protein A2014_03190 [Spirochaetes bacterium GWF1_49_6]